ncbi:hypothetical protein [Paraprevotella clara]|jgi:hypothetical protein|uniref:hypothetical protein n=1 Tax=Paraprevotella clara TaxID=454154 RepID=UPI00307C75DB
MDTEKKEIVEKKVYEDGKKEYASKSMAGTALGFGIAGTALGLWGASRRSGLGIGGGMPENVNINTVSDAIAGRSGAAPTAFQAWEKECEDAIALTNTIWGLKVNTMEQMYAHRDTDVAEKFGLWKSQVEGDFGNYKASRDLYDHMSEKLNTAAFGLYKGQRDLYDTLNERYSEKFCELDKKVYGMEIANLYQNKIIQMGLEGVLKESMCYTDRKTCRAIYGVVGLPSTPTTTVLEGANPFGCNCARQQGTAPTA